MLLQPSNPIRMGNLCPSRHATQPQPLSPPTSASGKRGGGAGISCTSRDSFGSSRPLFWELSYEEVESPSQEGAGHKAHARSQQERTRRELGWAGQTREKEMETLTLAGPPGGGETWVASPSLSLECSVPCSKVRDWIRSMIPKVGSMEN